MKTEAQVVIECGHNTIFGQEFAKKFIGKTFMGWEVIDAVKTTPRTIRLTILGELKFKEENFYFRPIINNQNEET